MSRSILVTPFRLAVAAATLVVGAALAGTGGAVAATMVTSADIKDGTIHVRDVSPGALTSFQTLRGYQIVRNQVVVPGESDGDLLGTCPPDKRATGVSAFWQDKTDAVQSLPLSDGSGGLALVHNNSSAKDILYIRVICATIR